VSVVHSAPPASTPAIGIRKRVVKVLWRHRAALLPVWILLGMTIMGRVLTEAPLAGRLGFLVAAAMGIELWRKGALRNEERRYKRVVIGAGGAWLLLSMIAGVGGVMHVILWVVGLAIAAPWWKHRWIRPKYPLQEQWAAEVGDDKGPLPGSRIIGVDNGSKRVTGDIALVAKRGQLASKIVDQTEIVAGCLNITMAELALEPHASGKPNMAKITLLKGGNPLQKVQKWDGAGIEPDGSAVIGTYADGSPIVYRWFNSDSVFHGMFSGGSGAGKSRLLDLLLCMERKSDVPVVSWVGDPQMGQSLPEWTTNVDRFAMGPEETVQMLADAYRVMKKRNESLASEKWVDKGGRDRTGHRGFTPTLEMPLLSVWIEEAHEVLADKTGLKLAEAISKMGRKCGVSLKIVTQHPDLSQIPSETLRSQLRMGNLIALRSASTQGVIASGGQMPDPSKLPKYWPDGSETQGICYTAGSSLMGRIFFVDEDETADIAFSEPRWCLPEFTQTQAVLDEPETLRLVTAAPQPIDVPAFAKPEKTAKDRVRDFVLASDGELSRGDIVAALDIPVRTIGDALARLVKEGDIEKPAEGKYVKARESVPT
jgi:hypothetical protein